MTREDFYEWLDTIIEKGNSDWELVEDFEDGTIYISFKNVGDWEEE